MTVEDATKEEKMDAAAQDVGEFMLHVITHYKGYEKEMALFMARSLGQYVSIVSKKPKEALGSVAKVIENFDFGTARANYYGYTLGVDSTRSSLVTPPKPASIIQMGEFKGKRDV